MHFSRWILFILILMGTPTETERYKDANVAV